uniref:hypothetical protein n=1 Tax=Dyadobacter bucti TaxID=2572203 RepID=UPI003F716B07
RTLRTGWLSKMPLAEWLKWYQYSYRHPDTGPYLTMAYCLGITRHGFDLGDANRGSALFSRF